MGPYLWWAVLREREAAAPWLGAAAVIDLDAMLQISLTATHEAEYSQSSRPSSSRSIPQ